MKVTLDVPDEFTNSLPTKAAELAAVLHAGLRSWHGRQTHEIQELDDVVEILAGLPSPEEVLALHPSAPLAARTSALLEKKRNEGLNGDEESEWQEIMRVEHLVRIAKAKAQMKLNGSKAA